MLEPLTQWLIATIQTLMSYGGGAVRNDLKIDTLPTIVNSIWTAVEGLAMSMTIIYFLYEVNNRWAIEGGDMTLKSFGAPFAKLAIAVTLIGHSKTLIQGNMLKFYNTMIGKASGWKKVALAGESSTALTDDEIKEKVNGLLGKIGIMVLLLCVILALILWIISIVLKFAWKYKAFMLKLEFLFRISISPLALTDIYNGSNSNALRWIKGMIGFCLYAAALIVLPALGAGLVEDTLTSAFTNFTCTKSGFENFLNFFNAMLGVIIAPFAELGVVSTIQSVCREAAN